MIRYEVGATVLRLYNNAEDALIAAKQRTGEWEVCDTGAGAFIHKEGQFVDIVGEFGRFLSNDQKQALMDQCAQTKSE